MKPDDILQAAIKGMFHVLIVDNSGVGRINLIRHILAQSRVPAVVFDLVDGYRGFVDYYGIYPINPFEFMGPDMFIDILIEVANVKDPAIGDVLETIFEMAAIIDEHGNEFYSIPDTIRWLYTRGPKYFKDPDKQDKFRNARTLLSKLANNILFSRQTHPALKDWLDGKTNTQIGIRLVGFKSEQIRLYVNTLLKIISLYGGRTSGEYLVILDGDPQYFTDTLIKLSPFITYLSKSYGLRLIVSTQDIPEDLRSHFNIIVDFNKGREPGKALVEIYPGSMRKSVNVSEINEESVVKDYLEVELGSIDNLKRSGVDWFTCLSKAGLNESALIKGSRRTYRDLINYKVLWDCLSGET